MNRAGIKEQNLDRTVWPGQDFYRFSCGGWLDANPLPDDFSSYGTYDELAELNRRQLKDLTLADMDALWDQAKKLGNKNGGKM